MKDGETGLTRHHNSIVDNGEDEEPNADSQARVVQSPGCLAVLLCPRPVPDVVGFTGLMVRKIFEIERVRSAVCSVGGGKGDQDYP